MEQKSQEDAEFQRQIEEYTAQGKSASIVEDESAKWAVYAISSNRKNQSFFNYYGPRKLVTQDKPGGGGEEPAPPAGVGKILLKKTAGGTTTGLAGARFSIYFNGQIVGSDITNAQGEIYVENAATGLWSFVETAAPDGFCVDHTPKSVYVDVSEGDREYSVAATNYELPDMKIIKRDAMSGKPIAGTVFSIKSVTGSYSTSVTTGTDGSATLSAIPAGVYVVREESVPEPYIVTNTEQTVALRPGKTSEVIFVDYEKPGLEIIKKNIVNGEPIEGVTYRIEQIDGSFSTSATTDNHGRIFLDSVPVGTFKVTEINVPNHVILCPIPQEVALKAGETSTDLLYALLTGEFTVAPPPILETIPLNNKEGVHLNSYLLELQKIPEPIRQAFAERGWQYTIDYAYLARLSEERNMSCIGATNYGSRQITVSSAGATVHEFGHFLDELMGFPSQTEGFYQEESGTAAALLRPYALTNEQEYFADCFVYWLTYRDNSKKMASLCSAAPKTYAYLLALESQNWQPAA